LTEFPSATVRRESLGHLFHNLSLYLSYLPSLCPSISLSLSLSTYLSLSLPPPSKPPEGTTNNLARRADEKVCLW
jgi:hypothetical protein